MNSVAMRVIKSGINKGYSSVVHAVTEFILEDGFPSKTGNSCNGFPSGINMKRKPSDG
jgi:hypothetical protein